MEAKIDKGEYKERDGSPAAGKWLCTKKFWSECKDAYIFGVDAKKDLSIDQLVDAPAQNNIRSREDKLVDGMVIYLFNLANRKAR